MIAKPKTLDQARDTGLAVVLLLLLAWFFKRNEDLILAAMAVLVLAMSWPMAFRPLSRLWFGLSHLSSSVASKILLSSSFYLVTTPIGLLRRLGGADAMRLRNWRNGDGSVFIARSGTFTASDLEKPY